jgi:hypothetical protein
VGKWPATLKEVQTAKKHVRKCSAISDAEFPHWGWTVVPSMSPFVGTWVVSVFWLLWLTLPWTWLCNYLFKSLINCVNFFFINCTLINVSHCIQQCLTHGRQLGKVCECMRWGMKKKIPNWTHSEKELCMSCGCQSWSLDVRLVSQGKQWCPWNLAKTLGNRHSPALACHPASGCHPWVSNRIPSPREHSWGYSEKEFLPARHVRTTHHTPHLSMQ